MIAAARRTRTAVSKISHDPISEIRPSPENDNIYRPVDGDDPEFRRLVESVKEHGIIDPIVATRDGWILSGHRRYAAAKAAGLKRVPVRYEDIRRDDDIDAFVFRLREYNRQRVKTSAERLREEVVSINQADAHVSLMQYRERESVVEFEKIEIVGAKVRAAITAAKAPMMAAIKDVLQRRRKFWPLSDRKIHYDLLNYPGLLIHASKGHDPESHYANNRRSYKALVELLTRARVAGLIPMNAIADETRPVTTWPVWQEVGGYIRDQADKFCGTYWRNLLQSQPNHIELLCEKNTLTGTLKGIASEYTIPMTSGRGFCSLPPRYDMVRRFHLSGKDKLVLLIVSDFDPEGEEIAHSFARSIRDDFSIPAKRIEPIKVALTARQAKEHNLPQDMEAKETSTNFAKFVEKYGLHAHELEALEPEVLQDILRSTIDSVIDRDRFDEEAEHEKRDAVFLEGVRRQTFEALGDIGELAGEGE